MDYIRSLFNPDKGLENLQDFHKCGLARKYLHSGCTFAEAVSYLYIGECYGFKNLLNRWAKAERRYAGKGFKTLSLDDFLNNYYQQHNLYPFLGEKLKENQSPVYHAELYREHYLGKVRPAFDFNAMMQDGQPRTGTFELPSTEKLEK